ncbi:MAG: DUF2089 domain-containing protein [Propionicimonas sp.]|uniref:DUF2089 domain-containing protein n=1 Tax=Propionicimonas sp. TaxID=1955623 RepID=UPI002B1F5D8D|nr:DUF2089 domain-containing protein [Propionicimonas sp.]MEA4943575.1 DUF2089 domain-containing protein [Propionicimonas sp.]MEA5054441.1 DUF2089 domain-containing protein [Propionicimonas sp.]MEA5116414.1 DUF2089 domain-containing protein [Propionicimonas sp.]
MSQAQYRPPSECPVCGGALVVTRLGCRSCGTEVAGEFAHCDFCSLTERETAILRVFLASRGNLREVEKHLGVSYPTARARFTEVLVKLGLAGEPETPPVLTRDQVLAEVASGALAPSEAAVLLGSLES